MVFGIHGCLFGDNFLCAYSIKAQFSLGGILAQKRYENTARFLYQSIFNLLRLTEFHVAYIFCFWKEPDEK